MHPDLKRGKIEVGDTVHLSYVDQLWSEIEMNTGILSNEANVNLWHDVMWKYLSFSDPEFLE